MTLHFFQKQKIPVYLSDLKYDLKQINGLINEKCHLILTLISKQQKCYFFTKQTLMIINF